MIDPFTIGLSALTLAGGAAYETWGKKKDKRERTIIDDIRDRLISLSEQVPQMTNRRQQLLKQAYGEAQGEGLRDIGEEYRGTRGFGASSLETSSRQSFLDKMARSLAEAELSAEEQGLQLQTGILGKAASIPMGELEEDTLGEDLMGVGGQMLGSSLMSNKFDFDDEYDKYGLSKYLPKFGRGSTARRPGEYLYAGE